MLVTQKLVLRQRQPERGWVAVGVSVGVQNTDVGLRRRHLLAPNREVTQRLETYRPIRPLRIIELSSLNYDSSVCKVSSVIPSCSSAGRAEAECGRDDVTLDLVGP